MPVSTPFRVGFVTGATPDKWAGIWRSRHGRDPLELVPITQDVQEVGLRDGSLDMALVRMPIDRYGLHCIPLYDERPVAVVGTEHLATLVDEVSLADLADEQLVLPHDSGWTPDTEQLDWPPMSVRDAIEVVASGAGVVIVPPPQGHDVPAGDRPASHEDRAGLAGGQRGSAGATVHRHRPRAHRAQLAVARPGGLPHGFAAPLRGKRAR